MKTSSWTVGFAISFMIFHNLAAIVGADLPTESILTPLFFMLWAIYLKLDETKE